MSNNLKAYVRYDGTGRVVSGSLILSRLKPKVGRWQEIDAVQCCNNVTTPSEPQGYVAGDFGFGGRIVYILRLGDIFYDPNVQHGLVASASELDIAVWGCSELDIDGANGFGIGAGNDNTTAMLTACPGVTGGEAAWFANTLISGGYDDWYLPSADELSILTNFPDADQILNVNSGYWTSTQTLNGQPLSWAARLLSNGYVESFVNPKNQLLRVKPFRSF